MLPAGRCDVKRAQDLETERSDSKFWVRHVLMVSLWKGRLNLEVGLTYKMEMTTATSDGLRRLEIVSVEFLAHWGASKGHLAKCFEVHVVFNYPHPKTVGFSGGSVVKKPPASLWDAGDLGSIPGSRWSPGGGNGNPLQCSCLGNPMDGGAWWATKSRKELDMIEHKHTHILNSPGTRVTEGQSSEAMGRGLPGKIRLEIRWWSAKQVIPWETVDLTFQHGLVWTLTTEAAKPSTWACPLVHPCLAGWLWVTDSPCSALRPSFVKNEIMVGSTSSELVISAGIYKVPGTL